MSGKNKDGMKVRRDMEKFKILPNLWPKVKEIAKKGKGTTTYLPPACYTLSRQEKRLSYKCLYGYSSNMRRLVSMTDMKLIGFKSHDCHVMI